MKLQENINKIRRSDEFVEQSFRIEATAKAFGVLSDNLYSNKIKAIIRELSCNAYDSHVEAGKALTPFVIHLPEPLDRTFRIRDYGVGISPDDIENVYTVFFASSKTDSNDYVGCLGLGSKAPFSYSDNFSVTSFFENKKYSYSCYKGEEGQPKIALISVVDSDEPSGLEVKMAVKEYDNNRFRIEAGEVFRWFALKPIFEGTSVPTIPEEPEPSHKGNGWFIFDRGNWCGALMGNVFYPINASNLSTFLEPALVSILKNVSPVLKFPIGALEPAPSREALSYNKRTVRAIKTKLEEIKKYIDQELQTQLAAETCKWNAILKLNEMNHGPFRAYVRDGSFEWSGAPLQKRIDLNKSYSSDVFYFSQNWRSKALQTRHRNYTYASQVVESDILYVLVDNEHLMPNGKPRPYSVGRFRTWMRSFADKYSSTTFRVFEDTKAELEVLVKDLGILEKEHYFWWHDMPQVPKSSKASAKKAIGRKKTESRLFFFRKNVNNFADQWGRYEEVDIENGEGFFIERNKNNCFYGATELCSTNLVHAILEWNKLAANLQAAPNVTIKFDKIETVHSFTPTQMKSKGDKWINVVDYLMLAGETVFTEEVALGIYINENAYQLSSEKQCVFAAVKNAIPNINTIKNYDKIASFRRNTLLEQEFIYRLNYLCRPIASYSMLRPEPAKFANKLDDAKTAIKDFWSFHPILKYIEYNAAYSNFESQPAWQDIIKLIKLKENL